MTSRAAAAFAVVALAGCAARPNVVYHQLGPGPRHDDWVPFRLTDSIVVIGVPAEGKDGEPRVSLAPDVVPCPHGVCDPLAVAAVPTEFREATFAIEPKTRRFVSTAAAPIYFPNSLRLKVLTIEAKDHRLEAINTVAALAAGAAKFAATGGDLHGADPGDQTVTLAVPVTIALADLRCAPKAAEGCDAASPRALPGNPGWTAALRFVDDPASNGLLAVVDIGKVHGAMIASACRRAKIELRYAPPPAAATVKPASPPATRPAPPARPDAPPILVTLTADLADPGWLVAVPFPAKGALTFHPLCGIDVQPQPVTEIGVDTMAAAFVHGVEQVAATQKP